MEQVLQPSCICSISILLMDKPSPVPGVRRALVMERVLGVLLVQDESIDPRLAIGLTRLIAQDADAMVRSE